MSLLSRLAIQAARAYGILSSKSTNVSASYLSVAGGGGGGGGDTSGGGGGAGAGGYRTSTFTLSTLNTYFIAVGAGGAGGAALSIGSNGSLSSISGSGITTVSSAGGGAGNFGASKTGNSGGSGGAGGYSVSTPGAGNTPSTSPSQGNNAGTGPGSVRASPGGGGASAVGGNTIADGFAVPGNPGGVGGAGTASSITGSSVTYAGGGGGGAYGTGGTGGAGGGGAGGTGAAGGTAGTTNLGGGGGGGGGNGTQAGGAGGSGIVIISYTSATPKFVGGTLTTSGGNQIHTFTSSGTLSPITPITASYLVVAGGGGAVGNRSGGGGAGGLLTSSTTLYSGATYVVTVGAGGAGGAGNAGVTSAQDGSNSVLSGTGLTTLTATGGGGGGGTNNPSSGRAGGSGGGGGGDNATGATGGTGVSGQGFAGGTPATGGGAGGGGASAVGSSGASNTGGNGGAGTASSITGTSVTYAGGGGGGATTTAGTGGSGGGGNGAQGSPTTQLAGVSGTQNLGGGAGGGSNYATTPVTQASGGSGIVIISYAGSQAFNGGLVTSSGGNTIHTFTSTGALTPLTNNLTNSLRFRASASAYLSRTPTLAGNRKTWTWSGWVKRGTLAGAANMLFYVRGSDTDATYFRMGFDFSVADCFTIGNYSGAINLTTTQVFRDPSAWYHIVVAMDTTQATASNRLKLYVNGNQVTAFSTANYPSLNTDYGINNTTSTIIGASLAVSNYYFDGYMTDINFIDGQALEPYYFGNNDANGVWKPILYKGTYGPNGYYLTFGNTTSTTTLGYDSSGNSNNWTTNNISLTAGTTYDAMTDVPTNTSATVANYAVLNPLNKDSGITVTQANLQATGSVGDVDRTIFSTMSIPSSQKIYFEVVAVTGSSAGNYFAVGIAPSTLSLSAEVGITGSFGIESNQTVDSLKRISGTATSYGAGTNIATNDIIQVAIDQASGKIWFGKNNTWFDSGNPSAGTNPATSTLSTSTEYFPVASFFRAGPTLAFNFGQRPFSYTPPTGFVRLNTFNLPTPTILQGNKYMDATTYTGNGASTQVIVNQGQFKPDLVWGQARSAAYGSWLFDSVRGATKQISSFSTNAESTQSTMLTAFNSNGFNMGSDTAGNQSSITYVGWQWQAGQGTTSSNTSGSITSTVSVNATAGFSIVTYSGNSTTSTIGHGLGVTPAMFIVKRRNSTGNWYVYHRSLGATQTINLNLTDAAYSTANAWNNTAPTSSVISVSGVSAEINNTGGTYVAYCFAAISGYSAFGSYTGNGSTDGPFVYTGFRPKFVLTKSASGAYSWYIEDTSRSTYNVVGATLAPNTSSAEDTAWGANKRMDILSNGFKIRASTVETNGSGATFIYMAFAENPFKNSNSR